MTGRPPPIAPTRLWRHIGSQGFPYDEAMVRDLAMRSFDRDARSAAGAGRQIGAITKSGDRRAELRGISAPTLVLHGDRDRMVHPSGGRSTAATIPGARLETIKGMGHDLPHGAWARLVDLIAAHAQRRRRRRFRRRRPLPRWAPR